MDKKIEHIRDEVQLLNEMADALARTLSEIRVSAKALDGAMRGTAKSAPAEPGQGKAKDAK